MKCFVHVGFDPKPKKADNPTDAIALAVKYLNALNDEFPKEERLSVKWRRDDLYPNNFLDYTNTDLFSYLKDNGEATLQLVEMGIDGLPIMGEIANIFTVDQEIKNNADAERALKSPSRNHLSKYKRQTIH